MVVATSISRVGTVGVDDEIDSVDGAVDAPIGADGSEHPISTELAMPTTATVVRMHEGMYLINGSESTPATVPGAFARLREVDGHTISIGVLTTSDVMIFPITAQA